MALRKYVYTTAQCLNKNTARNILYVHTATQF